LQPRIQQLACLGPRRLLTDMVFSGRPRERPATTPNSLATGYQTS
jgi:hypothetical protein